ncbi:MAG: DsbA family protein [Halolamina sp.]
MNRRSLLRATAAAGVTGVAGCLGVGGSAGDDGGGTGGGGDDGGEAGTAAGDGQTLETHPAGRSLSTQPTLGPDPAEATAVLVAFEDPSCPRCRRFERQTVPTIRRELVEPGDAAFVFRGYPVVYEWGKPATQALEATFARDEATTWELAGHYFDQQSSFTTDNVLSKTESFLVETPVDAATVVADAEERAHDDAVQTDLDAGDAAGYTATPTVVMFENGSFVAAVEGAQSYDVYANSLEVA